jgi:hypothetical protein
MCLEFLFNGSRKLPESDALGWIEHLTTAKTCNRKYRAGLSKMMCARESSTDGGSSQPTELPARIPPFGEIHLADSCDDQSKFQQAIEIYPPFIGRVPT